MSTDTTSTSKSIYFAGELFSFKHLAGNALVAQQIEQQSGQRYRCILPQALEQRETTARAIRDQDLKAVIESDVGLFHFDGPELDSGTVVEFMIAKMLDIPSVVVRTDFREGGDAGEAGQPWNLMVTSYPRTEVVLLDAMSAYQQHLPKDSAESQATASVEAMNAAIKDHASVLVTALDKVCAQTPILPLDNAEALCTWIARACGESLLEALGSGAISDLIERKRGQ